VLPPGALSTFGQASTPGAPLTSLPPIQAAKTYLIYDPVTGVGGTYSEEEYNKIKNDAQYQSLAKVEISEAQAKLLQSINREDKVSVVNGQLQIAHTDNRRSTVRTYNSDGTLAQVSLNGQSSPSPSDQFTLNDKGEWLYDGREGKLVQDAANGDRFDFPDGSYVQKIGDTLVEKRVEGNKVSFVLTKDGKSFTVPENLLSATFKDLKSKEAYVAHLPEYQDILKNNRLRQEDFRPSPDGKLVSADNSMRISFDGTNYLIQRGTFNPTTGNLEASSDFTEITLRRNQDGSLSVAEMRSKKGAAGIEIVEFPEAGGVVLNTGGTTRAFTREVKETGGSGRAFCDTNNVCIHPETGQMFTFKDGKFEDCDTDDCKKLAASLKEKLDEKRFTEGGPTNAEKTALQWLGAFESARSGFGSFASLLIGEENLASWRRQVDDFFCSTILLGGKECWVSEICSVYIPRSQKSTLIIQTPTGEYAPVAHVEGERQSLTFRDSDNTETRTEFLYKISLGVRNPEDSGQDVKFNVLLKGPVSDWLWEKDEKVEEGAEFRKAGKDMALLYRNETFTQACLVFKDGIVDAEGKETSQLCNAIVPAIR